MNRVQPDTTLPKRNAVMQYRANISQSSTNNIVQTVIKKDKDLTVTTTRESTGQYKITIAIEGDTDWSNILCVQATCQASSAGIQTAISYTDQDAFYLYTYNGTSLVDGGLANAALKIDVYTSKI